MAVRIAEINGGGPDVALRAMRFVPSVTAPTGIQVEAVEVDQVTSNWSVTAYAICSGQFSYPSAASTPSSAPIQTARATCGPGTAVVGGAADINGGGTDVVLRGSMPIGPVNPTSWEATAVEANSFEGNWSVTVTAVCSPAGFIFASPGVSVGSNIFQIAQAGCNAGDQSVLLGGGRVDSVDGPPALRTMREAGGLWRVIGEETDPVTSNMTVTSQPLCMQHWP
jgi:hypothetical protein